MHSSYAVHVQLACGVGAALRRRRFNVMTLPTLERRCSGVVCLLVVDWLIPLSGVKGQSPFLPHEVDRNGVQPTSCDLVQVQPGTVCHGSINL